MTQPIISTVIISRPQEPRLQRAIQSALWQQGPAFEVVLVLDGACSYNERTVSAFDDRRLRVFKHSQSLGRGAARARAVEEARGQWIANVDADDWIFPDKNVRQWKFLAAHPDIDLVSGGLLIVDREGVPQGVRSHSLRGRGWSGGALPPLFTPSLMLRASLAKSVSFDARCRAGEDRDFLYRALPDATWAALDDASYVYDEYASHSLERCLSSYGRRVILEARYGGARSAGPACIKNAAKALVASAAFMVGQGDRLVQRRSGPVSQEQIDRYARLRLELSERSALLCARGSDGA